MVMLQTQPLALNISSLVSKRDPLDEIENSKPTIGKPYAFNHLEVTTDYVMIECLSWQ